MRVVHSDLHRKHEPEIDLQAGRAAKHVDRPERVDRILHALSAYPIEAPTEHGLALIEAMHEAGLIAFLSEAREPTAAQYPDTILHPAMRRGMAAIPCEPQELVGRLGYWCFDTGTPLMPGTYAAARSAVDVALTATDLVINGERISYGLCRPPGHHAGRSFFGGFCYFNNAAIAAECTVQRTGEKVAVLDLDYHHGNGTQQIFYDRADVQYVSLHADPRHAYPFFTGHADETGSGAGLGTTLNVPLPAGTTDDAYLAALEQALETVIRFAPGMLIVSLGMDTYSQDPLGDFSLTTAVYAKCGRRVAETCSRLVVLQEGGYYLPALGENVRQWLVGAESA